MATSGSLNLVRISLHTFVNSLDQVGFICSEIPFCNLWFLSICHEGIRPMAKPWPYQLCTGCLSSFSPSHWGHQGGSVIEPHSFAIVILIVFTIIKNWCHNLRAPMDMASIPMFTDQYRNQHSLTVLWQSHFATFALVNVFGIFVIEGIANCFIPPSTYIHVQSIIIYLNITSVWASYLIWL